MNLWEVIKGILASMWSDINAFCHLDFAPLNQELIFGLTMIDLIAFFLVLWLTKEIAKSIEGNSRSLVSLSISTIFRSLFQMTSNMVSIIIHIIFRLLAKILEFIFGRKIARWWGTKPHNSERNQHKKKAEGPFSRSGGKH